MADNYSLCLVGVMDRLWFHKLILFSESTTLLISKTLANNKPHLLTEPVTYKYSPSSSSVPSVSSPPHGEAEEEAASPPVEQEIPLESPPPTTVMVKHQDEGADQFEQKERPTRLNHVTSRARSHSSFSFTDEERRPRKHRHSGARRRLKKSRSCRSLGDLELEEVKGFMDLGFVFKKERVSPRMLSVLPGLQRLWFCKAKQNSSKLRIDSEAAGEAGDCKLREDDEKRRRAIIRPYLSEAWLIKRPDSPLLNLRVPRVSAAADMKKHLKFWARTVASVVEQES